MATQDESVPPATVVGPRRSCLLVPGSAPGMLGKAATLQADEICMDLEDSVAPAAKEEARDHVIDALRSQDMGERTVSVRVNAVATSLAYRDVVDVIEAAGEFVDCVVVPKVQAPGEVEFVDHLLRMIEEVQEFEHRIGLEVQVANAAGLTMVDELAFASDRLEALVLSGGDMAASLGMPHLTVGEDVGSYPGDLWHDVRMRILVAARTAGLQVLDGPYARIRDLDGYRRVAQQAQMLGFDGKWALHPDQIGVANAVFSPSSQAFERAEDLLTSYRRAVEERTGAVMVGDALVDDATRRLAEVTVMRGRAAGLHRRRSRG